MRQSTGKFDVKGEEIFVGDKVLKTSMFFLFKGEKFKAFKMYQVRMLNECGVPDEMSCGKCEKVYAFGKKYHPWKGNEVLLLSEEDLQTMEELGVKEGKTDVFCPEEGVIKVASPTYTECHTTEEKFKYLGQEHLYNDYQAGNLASLEQMWKDRQN